MTERSDNSQEELDAARTEVASWPIDWPGAGRRVTQADFEADVDALILAAKKVERERLRPLLDAMHDFDEMPTEVWAVSGRSLGKSEYTRLRVNLHNAYRAIRGASNDG